MEAARKISVIAVTVLMLVSPVSSVWGREACHFAYDDKVINDVIVPILKSKLVANYEVFNVKEPLIIANRPNGDVHITLSQAFFDKGIFARDSDLFDIILDPCTLKVKDAHLTRELTGTFRR